MNHRHQDQTLHALLLRILLNHKQQQQQPNCSKNQVVRVSICFFSLLSAPNKNERKQNWETEQIANKVSKCLCSCWSHCCQPCLSGLYISESTSADILSSNTGQSRNPVLSLAVEDGNSLTSTLH